MASPFSFFRKNQQSMMVVLVILAMLVFTLDSVFSSRENQFTVLGLVLGGTIFAIAGIGSGRWMQYGAGGAILGAACGFFMPYFVSTNAGNAAVISTSLGTFDDRRIYDLQLQRGVADQFMMRATEEAFGEGTAQFATRFGFGHQSEREDVIFGEMMRSEADDLGIVVTNEMVSDYLNKATGDKLTAQGFARARSNLSIEGKRPSEEQLFDVLRSEIKARMAYQTLRPQVSVMPPPPETYYQLYRRLNVSQRLNTAKIDVDAFLDQIPEPTDAEISELFAKGRLYFPNEKEPGSAGFRQPRKIKLAYLEADYKKVEAEVAAVSDEEIEAYYNENRETLYRRPVTPAAPQVPSTPATEAPAEEAAVPSEGSAPESGTDSPPEVPQTSEQAPEPATEDTPKSETSPAPQDEKQPEDTSLGKPESETGETAKPVDDGSECGPQDEQDANSEQVATDGDKTDDSQAEETSQSTSATTESPSPQTPEETGVQADSPASNKASETNDATAGTTDQTSAIPLTIPATAGDASTSDEAPQFPEPQYEIRPLDDDLKNEIRDQLLYRRVREALESRAASVLEQMKTKEVERRKQRFAFVNEDKEITEQALSEKMREYSASVTDFAKELAADTNTIYVETGSVAYRDLTNDEDYPLGSATPPGGNPFAPSGATVADTAFSLPGDDLQFFVPRRAVRTSFDLDGGETQYIWWIVDNIDGHVPTLEETGIREEVVLAWKRAKARDLAKARADELAQQVKDGLALPEEERKPMATTLESALITGTENSASIAVRQTLLFTWMRQQMNQQMNFMQQAPEAVLSQIQFADESGDTLELAFDDFMKAVFEDLDNLQVGVVPNADFSSYYIVQVIDRTPTPEIGEDALRERFLTEGKQFGFGRSALFAMMQQSIANPAAIEWEKNLWRKYDVDPDARPEQ